LKDTFVSQFYPKRELETAQIIAEYCKGNLANIDNIREEMGSLASGGTKKMIEEIDALERMLQEIMNASNQAGAGINRNPLPIPFTDMYKPMYLNCQQRDLLIFQLSVIDQVLPKIPISSPSIVQVALGKPPTEKMNRDSALQCIELLSKEKEDLSSTASRSYSELRDQLDLFQEEMYRDKITPKLREFQKAMRIHLGKFKVIEEELESRHRTITSGLNVYKRFEPLPLNFGNTVTIPASWNAKLGLLKKNLKLSEFQTKIYNLHLENCMASS